MSFRLSPGIDVREIDLTGVVPAVATTFAGFAGSYTWGPVGERVLIGNEKELVGQFGKPSNTSTYESFFSAANYLMYSNRLYISRAIHETLVANSLTDKLGTTDESAVVVITHTAHGLVNGDTVYISGVAAVGGILATDLNGVHIVTKLTDNTYSFVARTTATSTVATGGGTFTVSYGEKALNATAEKYTGSGFTGEGILIKNDTIYSSTYEDGSGDIGPWVAKYPGTVGNGIKVSLCDAAAFSQSLTVSTTGTALTGTSQLFLSKLEPGSVIIASDGQVKTVVSITNDNAAVLSSAFSADLSAAVVTAKWQYYQEFPLAPSSSAYVVARNGSNDEIHVVVVDTTGNLSDGNVNTVLEKYAFLSVALDAKGSDNESLYYKTVINNQSDYIRWMDHPSGNVSWGSESNGIAYSYSGSKPISFTLAGGKNGLTTLTNGDKIAAFSLFADSMAAPISLLICGNANQTIVDYCISLAEARKDLIVFFAPEKADVVFNSGSELEDIMTYRTSISSSSYAFMVDNWKLQYNRYQDVNVWVPLCGDIAGLAAKTDMNLDPWYSFAGLNRGQVRGAIRLAWQANEAQRDLLYPVGINSVVTKPGEGTVLFGDRTLVSRPGAFQNIGVRRLFIVIEKAIAAASQKILFEFNDEVTQNMFKAMVNGYLRDIQSRRGVLEYKVIADVTNNTPEVVERQEFVGDIFIKPNKSINFIRLSFVAVKNSTSFSEVVMGSSFIL